MNRFKRTCLAFMVLAASTDAVANVPAPYVFLGMAQLLIGNALIGLGEGWLIARLFKVPAKRAILWMIPANYFSAWVGIFVPSVEDFSPSLDEVGTYLSLGVAAFFLLTVILEWPFVWTALKGVNGRLPKSLGGTLIAQTASYVVLIPLYWAGSQTTLLTHFHLDREPPTWADARAVIYYLSSDGRRIMKLPLRGPATPLLEISPLKETEYLHVERSSERSSLDLWAGQTPVARAIASLPRPDEESGYERCSPKASGFYCAVDLRPQKSSAWEVKPLFGRGLRATTDRERVYLALETPLLELGFRAITVVPGDQVIFEVTSRSFIGWRNKGLEFAPRRHQICLLDLNRRTLSVIAEGAQPIVVLMPKIPQ